MNDNDIIKIIDFQHQLMNQKNTLDTHSKEIFDYEYANQVKQMYNTYSAKAAEEERKNAADYRVLGEIDGYMRVRINDNVAADLMKTFAYGRDWLQSPTDHRSVLVAPVIVTYLSIKFNGYT